MFHTFLKDLQDESTGTVRSYLLTKRNIKLRLLNLKENFKGESDHCHSRMVKTRRDKPRNR